MLDPIRYPGPPAHAAATRFPIVVVAAAVMLFAIGPTPTAFAQSFPDMTGAWTGTTEAVIIGDPNHYMDDPSKSGEPRIVSTELTLNILGQDGRRFWGTAESKFDREPVVCVFRSDAKTVICADDDGYPSGHLLTPGALELCYQQTLLGGAKVAGCALFVRRD